MTTYSQNGEDLKVLQYFANTKGTVLEIGANDGQLLSNSRLLIENGWNAHLIEPSSTFAELSELYAGNENVKCYNYGIGENTCKSEFYESGNHYLNGNDKALVSSCICSETYRWRHRGVAFTKTEIQLKTLADFYEEAGMPNLDFISIDVEGLDWEVLKQIDLDKVGCKCLCIEYNGKMHLEVLFTNYCNQYGMQLIHKNGENLIFSK